MKREFASDMEAAPSVFKKVLDENDAVQYDRQIRLWGAAGQQRLKESAVVVVGLNGCAAEVVKNIVLAGVGRVVLMDDGVAEARDTLANFLLRPVERCVGHNRARGSLENAQELNPRVRVEVVEAGVWSQDETWYKGFQVIVASNRTLKECTFLDGVARKNGSIFLACGTHGYVGFLFSDANGHMYLQEQRAPAKSAISIEVDLKDGAAVVADGDSESAVAQPQATRIENARSFADVVSERADWTKLRADSKSKAGIFALQLLWHFQDKFSRLPTPQDYQSALGLRDELCRSHGVENPSSVLTDTKVEQALRDARGEMSPVCAITGGVVGQHLIRLLTGKGKPLENFFIYDERDYVSKTVLL